MLKKLKALYDKAHAFWRSEESTLAGKAVLGVAFVADAANRSILADATGLNHHLIDRISAFAAIAGALFITPRDRR